ncbi:MAG: FAD-binding oxidoreductase [Gammaproteobacteria bacterium]|nr:FAD-binding oxidoreductase [Gammaproteobacteria bacterium]
MSAVAPQTATVATVLERLEAILGADHLLTGDSERAFFSQDVYRAGKLVMGVAQPADVVQLREVLRTATTAGVAVIARGGGMSYTDAYLPVGSPTLMVDTRRLNRIVEINAQARYVVVECGITWSELHTALAPLGLSTPYWGPLSGLRATIGGALSQGSIFLGSGQYGSVADSVLAMEVVAADGQLVRTGSWAGEHAEPFFRHHGPDMTGLFTGDCGALGFKARAVLRLVSRQPESRYISYAFDDHETLTRAMGEVARAEVVSECFAFDPFLQGLRMQRGRLRDDMKSLGNVVKAAGGGIKGLKEGAKLALAGRGFLEDVPFSLHLSMDGRDVADADSRAAAVRRAVGSHGREIENSVPKVMRATPFAEVNSMLGPDGQRWAPVHGILPLTQAAEAFASTEALFARRRETDERHGIDHGYLMCTISNHGFLLEPCLYWRDARQQFHETVLDDAYLARLKAWPENLAAREAVEELRIELADHFHALGATAFQLGKFYPYSRNRDAGQWALLCSLKAAMDPAGLLNPGALGLGG